MKNQSSLTKANNYSQALKEANNLDQGFGEKILKDQIPANEADKYHVLLVSVKDRPGQAKNEVGGNVQIFGEKGFKKLLKNFPGMGITTMIVLHDPKKGTKEASEVTTDIEDYIEGVNKANPNQNAEGVVKTQSELEAEIEARIDAKYQAKFDQMVADANEKIQNQNTNPNQNADDNGKDDQADKGGKIENEEGKTTQTSSSPSKKLTAEELEPIFHSVGTMTDFATKEGIDVTGLKKRDEFIKAITTWNEAPKK